MIKQTSSMEKKYKALSFKLIAVALIAALSGIIGFILGILCQSLLIIACSALIVSIGALLGNFASHYMEKSRKITEEIRR